MSPVLHSSRATKFIEIFALHVLGWWDLHGFFSWLVLAMVFFHGLFLLVVVVVEADQVQLLWVVFLLLYRLSLVLFMCLLSLSQAFYAKPPLSNLVRVAPIWFR